MTKCHEKILTDVEKYYKIDKGSIAGHSRRKTIARARRVACNILINEEGLSLRETGAVVNKCVQAVIRGQQVMSPKERGDARKITGKMQKNGLFAQIFLYFAQKRGWI
jgi:hypothetical protein